MQISNKLVTQISYNKKVEVNHTAYREAHPPYQPFSSVSDVWILALQVDSEYEI